MGLVRAAASDSNRKASAAALEQITRSYSDKLLQAGRRHCRGGRRDHDSRREARWAPQRHSARVVVLGVPAARPRRKNAARLRDSDRKIGRYSCCPSWRTSARPKSARRQDSPQEPCERAEPASLASGASASEPLAEAVLAAQPAP
jgi:hypothetical protein